MYNPPPPPPNRRQGRGQACAFPTIPERVLKVSHCASCTRVPEGLASFFQWLDCFWFMRFKPHYRKLYSTTIYGNQRKLSAAEKHVAVTLLVAKAHESTMSDRSQNPRLHQSNCQLPLFCVSNCACAPLPVHLSMCTVACAPVHVHRCLCTCPCVSAPVEQCSFN